MTIKIEGNVGQVVSGGMIGSVQIKMRKKGMTVTTSAATDWSRGYFCAVATLLRSEGNASVAVVELFKQGGDPRKAEPHDLELFRQHGLV